MRFVVAVRRVQQQRFGATAGDLVYIPPDVVHSLRPTGGGAIHCFCFAVAVKGAPEIDYTSH